MNTKRQNWTQIEIAGDDTGDDSSFKLDIEGEEPNEEIKTRKEITEDEELLNVREEGQNNRRQRPTLQANKENQNNKARTEDEEDQEERTVQKGASRELDDEEDSENSKRNNRAHKRIQTLLARERNTQTELAQKQAENLELRRALQQIQRRSAETTRDAYKEQLDSVEKELIDATQANDAERIAKASRKMASLTIRHEAMTAVADEPEEEIVEEVPKQPQQDLTAAKTWLNRNPQFRTDRTFHVNARLISEDLTREGALDPEEDEYWQELDKRLKKTLRIDPEPEPQKRKSSPISSRSDEDSEDFRDVQGQFKRSGNRVQATPTAEDYEIAEKFNLKIKDLMAEKYKYAQVGNKGYVQIDIPGQT